MFGLDMNVLKMVLVAFAAMNVIKEYPRASTNDAITAGENLIRDLFKRYGIDWE
jgi:hypothetical protein